MTQTNLFSEEKKVPRNWGIRRKDLETLFYDDLKMAFYGLHNLNVHAEMLDVSNPDEIMAYYIGAGMIKRNDYPSQFMFEIGAGDADKERKRIVNFFARNSANPGSLFDIVKLLNREAYKGSLKILAHKCNRRFAPRTQSGRLASISDEAKAKFIASMQKPYRASNREELSNPYAFRDPNIDGKSSTIYADRIYDFLKDMYDKAHSS